MFKCYAPGPVTLLLFVMVAGLSCLQTPDSGSSSSFTSQGTPASYSSLSSAGAGRVSGNAQLQVPICGCASGFCRKTSGFGNRIHPILGVRRFHQGLDLAAPSGHPVRAAEDGVVTRGTKKSNGGWGNRVVIRHNKVLKNKRGRSVSTTGFETQYNHLRKISVRPGQRVRKGQVIGTVGSTGLSTGPHLDMNVRANGQYLDPARFFNIADMRNSCSSGQNSRSGNRGQEAQQ